MHGGRGVWEAFGPGNLGFPQISAPARPPRPLISEELANLHNFKLHQALRTGWRAGRGSG